MNPNQLATMDEAKAIAAQLGTIGGGVKNIYIPQYGGPYLAPSNGAAMFYTFLFNDGADGFNVGLIRTLSQTCPTTWLNMIATEITYQVKS